MLVVYGKSLEELDMSSISTAVILTNIPRKSRLLFDSFFSQCTKRSSFNDSVTAVVISHPKYSQLDNYNAYYNPILTDMEDNIESDQKSIIQPKGTYKKNQNSIIIQMIKYIQSHLFSLQLKILYHIQFQSLYVNLQFYILIFF